ncbi:MAG: helix-turn-helix domain-containing protein [Thermosynechococcaceae cyanobacterium MS004]|nr:helix-turn-helix domain-containing protein [Thermosynechococcaceae cyanobacterium MS004]
MKATEEKTYAGETVETGSGNVFADLGLPNPEERLAKSQLVQRISEIIKERKLTQAKAGKILGIDQAKVSKLVRGRLSEFSTSTLMEYLTRLDQDVEIVVRPKPRSKEVASLLVSVVDA